MRIITINSPKFGSHEVFVDDADYERIVSFKWVVRIRRGAKYALRNIRTADCRSSREMHKEIMGDLPKGFVWDHRDGNGLNNCRSNLRPATRSQNNFNVHRQPIFSSRYRGVWWDSLTQRWRSKIVFNGKKVHIGYFKDEMQAAVARDIACLKHHGEFAVLNFPIPETLYDNQGF